ncbi:hypothetical protein HYX14_00105 [Candidatus Woesearchaeota archaeon]|nr:hypothetical protein [Candidatus Woesearchaeota archaeon]
MTRYYCMECGYKHTPKSGTSNRCPWCGGRNVRQEMSAGELLKDTNHFF